MDRIRKLIQCFLAIALIAIAVPSAAADKQYTATIVALSTTQYAVTFTNAPDGNSQLNSLSLKVPAGTIVSASLTVANKSYTPGPTSNFAQGFVAFVDIKGFGPGKSAILTFTVNVASCAAQTLETKAYTGNTLGGVEFFQTNAEPQIACDVVLSSCSPPSTYQEVSGGNTTTIERLEKPGFPCDPTAFNVLFTDFDNTVEIQWTGQVQLRTTTQWPPTYASSTTTQFKQTWVAWERFPNNQIKYIPVPACTTDQPLSATTDPFPFISSTALMPDGTPHLYAGQQARICAVEETNLVLPDSSTCPQPPPVPALGCHQKDTILLIRDDVWLTTR